MVKDRESKRLMERENKVKKSRKSKLKFVVFTLFLASISVNAQDVITLKNGDDIQALVQKVGDADIEYKKWDNQTGPVYVIKKSEVFMIKYRNGTKDVFNTVAKPEETQVTKPVENRVGQPRQLSSSPSENLKNEFYGSSYNDRAMLEFFRRNNFHDYYSRFNAACNQRTTADVLVGIGSGFTGLGLILIASGVSSYNYRTAVNCLIAGYVFIGVGQPLWIASIPVYVVSGVRKRTIKSDFARQYLGGYAYQPTLNIGITQNGGFGLTLNF